MPEDGFRVSVESSPIGMVLVDASARIVLVNRQVECMLGHRREELIGQPVETLVPERFRGGHPASRDRFVSRAEARPMGHGRDLSALRKDGTEIPVEIGLNPVRTDEGLFVLATLVDRSEQEALRRQLLVKDRMVTVGTLAAGLAHGINNPLAYVMANLDFAGEELRRLSAAPADLPPDVQRLSEIQRALAEAEDGGRRIHDLVSELLRFSRSEPAARKPIDVRALLDSALTMTTSQILDRARLVKRYEKTPPVDADPTQLIHVFMNLLTNAAQAIPQGASDQHEVRVTTSTDSRGRAVVEILDTGSGIGPEDMDRLFAPFFTTKPVGHGTGLGLWVAHGIVTALGGEITVESAEQHGAVFRIALPPARPAEA